MFNKTLKITTISAALIGLLPSSFADNNIEPDGQPSGVSTSDVTVAASMIHLIANPEPFEGWKVSVLGYIGGLGGNTAFLTREHSESGDFMSSVNLQLKRTNGFFGSNTCDGHYAYITGTVKLRKFEHYSIVSLVDIEQIRIADELKSEADQNCYVEP